MIGPGCVGLVESPYAAIALFCVGGFAHQTISVLVNTLSADLFDSREVGTVSGFAGMAAWIGGLGFSLLVGQLADTLGYGPLFGLLGGFDLLGAIGLIVLLRGAHVDGPRTGEPRDRPADGSPREFFERNSSDETAFARALGGSDRRGGLRSTRRIARRCAWSGSDPIWSG